MNSPNNTLSNIQINNASIKTLLKERYTLEDIEAIETKLKQVGTFTIEPLANGLFPAALALQDEFEYTGYHHVWVRDNVQVAYGKYVAGEVRQTVACIHRLAEFFLKYRQRFDDIIATPELAKNQMRRPHIRFDGETLAEREQEWPHAQNDALGYFLWLAMVLHRDGHTQYSSEERELFQLFVNYFAAVQYWRDEESGHWEEVRKVAASSIGVAYQGLLLLRQQFGESPEISGLNSKLDDLLEQGQQALADILPAECIQDDPLKNRKYDAALLFLAYPVDCAAVSHEMRRRIALDVREHLMGHYGIKRYLGDSYWCADYKAKLEPEERTGNYSDDLASRDAMLNEGEEAQWCIFDPILSCMHGQWYQQEQNPTDLEWQTFHFNRSLGQLTGEDSPFGPLRCPESYYIENGQFGPNDITPLLWTQANLLQAVELMKNSLRS